MKFFSAFEDGVSTYFQERNKGKTCVESMKSAWSQFEDWYICP